MILDLYKDHIDTLWLAELISFDFIHQSFWVRLIDDNTRVWSSKEIKLLLMKHKQDKLQYISHVIMFNNSVFRGFEGTSIIIPRGLIRNIITRNDVIHIKNDAMDIFYKPAKMPHKHILYLKSKTSINLKYCGKIFIEYIILNPIQSKILFE